MWRGQRSGGEPPSDRRWGELTGQMDGRACVQPCVPFMAPATDAVYVLAMYEQDSAGSRAEAQRWIAQTAARVQALAAAQQGGTNGDGEGLPQRNGDVAAVRGVGEQGPRSDAQQQGVGGANPQPEPFRLREGRQRYLDNVGACMQVCVCVWCVCVGVWLGGWVG